MEQGKHECELERTELFRERVEFRLPRLLL